MEIKMKKIEPKSWKDREDIACEKVEDEKSLPSGHLYFDDVPELKDCVMGSTVFIKQKVKITNINKTSVGFDIEEIGAVKDRSPREVKDEDEDD
jgi:hypothetical protein